MPLSEFAVRKAKPREKPYRLADGGGLFLSVQPNGAKFWHISTALAGRRSSSLSADTP